MTEGNAPIGSPPQTPTEHPSPSSSTPGENSTYRQKLRRRRMALLLLCFLVLAVAAYGLGLGPDPLPWSAVWQVILERLGRPPEHPLDLQTRAIIWEIRAPRVALGLIVGGALAGSGAVYQALFRNAMADPYIIGISSGAALGAVLQIALQDTLSQWGENLGPLRSLWQAAVSARPLFAFTLGILTVLLVYHLSLRRGRSQSATLLLCGVAASSLLSALMALVLVLNTRGEQLTGIVFWLMGGLQDHPWTEVLSVCPWVLGGTLVSLLCSRWMNLMLLGDETAQQLGVSPEKLRRLLLAATTLSTAAAVSLSGIIGFVGLIVPHLVRLLWGPDYRTLLPASILAGAGFLVLADGLARTALAPQEIPVGIITALVGAPFFLALLRSKGNT